eukprot:TRINITY_DN3690_c0_g1_i1.p1 TRINITY_DN3690_c0_g1~~TRINITY_DN3690_c0_g1_i1.p1  ORF type:complete len:297 (+),score=48.89 TRINITY_DN3690_c0_g1_i1:185-1075(+)
MAFRRLPSLFSRDMLPRSGVLRSATHQRAMSSITKFEVYRWAGDANPPHVDVFDVDTDNCGPMILDALIKIKNEIDPSLAFRRSCREGVCGSCSMNISGNNTLACLKSIKDSTEANGRVRINPLPHMAIIKDLVPDTTNFFQQLHSIEPWLKLTPEQEASDKEVFQTVEDRKKLDGLYECVLCACCSTSCPSYWWSGEEGYLGPAVLMQAFRWISDTRDIDREGRLNRLISHGVKINECHTILNCAAACPKNLNPGRAILNMKAMALAKRSTTANILQNKKNLVPETTDHEINPLS